MTEKEWPQTLLKTVIVLGLPLLVFIVLQNDNAVRGDDWINVACIFHSNFKVMETGEYVPVGSGDLKRLIDFVENLISESKGSNLGVYILCHDHDREAVIKSFPRVIYYARKHGVKVRFESLSLETIFSQLSDAIEHSRKHYGDREHEKFYQPTFHFRQMYHKIFPVDKILVLDIDLDFRVSVQELYLQFNNMNSSQMIGIVYDQTPYYHMMFEGYRLKHPDTHIGSPLPGYPGFNGGLVLLDLEKMRNSKDYEFFLTDEGANIFKKYELVVRIGDQDFYTLLAIERPELFYILGCEWNRQMDPLMFVVKDFDFYHYCSERGKIYHGNGGSEVPPRVQN